MRLGLPQLFDAGEMNTARGVHGDTHVVDLLQLVAISRPGMGRVNGDRAIRVVENMDKLEHSLHDRLDGNFRLLAQLNGFTVSKVQIQKAHVISGLLDDVGANQVEPDRLHLGHNAIERNHRPTRGPPTSAGLAGISLAIAGRVRAIATERILAKLLGLKRVILDDLALFGLTQHGLGDTTNLAKLFSGGVGNTDTNQNFGNHFFLSPVCWALLPVVDVRYTYLYK